MSKKRKAPSSGNRLAKKVIQTEDGKRPVTTPLWHYVPDAIPGDRSGKLYDVLTKHVRDLCEKHGVQKVRVFGKEYEQQRQVAYFEKQSSSSSSSKKQPYAYSGTTPMAHEWTPELDELAVLAARLVKKESGDTCVFPRALVNWYENGSKNVGAHRDNDAMNGTIVSFSLIPDGPIQSGSERPFVIYDAPERSKHAHITARVTLRNRSAFIMLPGMQSAACPLQQVLFYFV